MPGLFKISGSLFVIALFIAQAGAAPQASRPSPAPSVGEDTNSQLRNAVIDSQKQLGSMDVPHKKMFDEEVTPQFSLFIKDYHQQGSLVQAQVDTDGIKNYLGFSAAKDLALGTSQLLLFMNADSHCEKCTAAAPEIRKMMQTRAQSHGFTPVWITPEELLDTKPSELAERRNAAGFMEVTLKPAPQDDVDSAHADEKKFISSFTFDVRGLAHYDDQSELFDTDSFEQAATKMLTQAYVELGAKSALSGANSLKQEMQITASGFSDFNQYNQMKAAVQNKLKDIALLEERKISRGKAVFALKTNRSLDEIKQMIGGLTASLGPGVALSVEIR